MIEPKQQYLKLLKPDSNVRNVLLSDDIQMALSFSMAELSLRTSNSEHIEGAKKFVEIFTSIATPSSPPPSFPDKTLKSGSGESKPQSDKKGTRK